MQIRRKRHPLLALKGSLGIAHHRFALATAMMSVISMTSAGQITIEAKEYVSTQTYGITASSLYSYPTRHAAFAVICLPTDTLRTSYDIAILGTTEVGFPYIETPSYSVYSTAPTYVSNYGYVRAGNFQVSQALVYSGISYGWKIPVGFGSAGTVGSGQVEVVITSHLLDPPYGGSSSYCRFDLSKLKLPPQK